MSRATAHETGSCIERFLPALDVVQWEFDWMLEDFSWVGPGVERLLGYDAEEWCKSGFWLSHLHRLDRGWVPEYCRLAYHQGRDHSIRYRMTHADGSTVWIKQLVGAERFGGDGRMSRGLMARVRWPRIPVADRASYPLTMHEGIDEVALMVLEIDPEGTVLWANRALAQFLGRWVEELIGINYVTLIEPSSQERTIAMTAEDALRTGDTRTPALLDMRGEDGAVHRVEVLRSVVRSSDGLPCTTLLLMNDVTSREIELDHIRTRVDELQTVVDASGELYLHLTPDGTCIDCRIPHVCPLPQPDGGYIGQSVYDLHPPALHGPISEALSAVERGEVFSLEVHLGAGESESAVEVRGVPLPNSGCAFIIKDVSSRQRHQKRLARSEAKLRSIVNGLPMAIHVYRIDDQGILRLTAANPAADEIMCMLHDEYLGLPLVEVFPYTAELGIAETYRRVALEGGVYENPHLEYEHHGMHGIYDVQAFQSEPREVTVLFEEVTERELRADLQAAYRDRLRALAAEITMVEDRERRRIAQELHDRVSQALAVCRMHLRQFQVDCGRNCSDGDDADKALRLLDRAIQETRSITTELFPPVLQELGLPTALKWLCEEGQVLFGLSLTPFVQVSKDLEMDESRQIVLFRAARELIANVRRHSGAETASLSLFLDDSSIVLEVEDDGCGFELPDTIGTVGHGFGLFSLRERVEQLGGVLQVERSESGGACVRVSMPLE